MKFKNKNVLVTGANGMIAYQLVKLLKKKNCNLTLTDIQGESKFFNDEKYISGDLRSRSFSDSICKGQDIIFSLVGMKGSPQRCIEAPASLSIPMTQFNANIIESAHKNDVEWFYIQVQSVCMNLRKFFMKKVYGILFHLRMIGMVDGLKEWENYI